MREIDGALPTMLQRDTVVTLAGDSIPHRVTIWLMDSTNLRKLVVTDSSEKAGLISQTSFWFVGGEVSVVQHPTDMLAIDADRIILWTDETLEPRTDVTEQARMAKETATIDEARRWAGVFGIKLP